MKDDKNVLDELLQTRIPKEYAATAVLQRAVLTEVFARMEFMILQPDWIVDIGCATGDGSATLKKHYPNAHVIAIDSSPEMLDYAKDRLAGVEWLCASYTSLPLPDHSVDLLLANWVLPWCDELPKLMQEWRRVLRPNGLLMLTSLGPDTLHELHDLPLAFPHLMDMHTVGDLLTGAGFSNPVLDVDYFTLTYREQKKLWHELQMSGMIAGNVEEIQLEKPENHYALTYEIIFAHAWGPDLNASHVVDEKGEVRIPLSHILRR